MKKCDEIVYVMALETIAEKGKRIYMGEIFETSLTRAKQLGSRVKILKAIPGKRTRKITVEIPLVDYYRAETLNKRSLFPHKNWVTSMVRVAFRQFVTLWRDARLYDAFGNPIDFYEL